MSKEQLQELSRLIGELNTHAYATNEHYHNCYEKICDLIDVLKQQPSEVDQLLQNLQKSQSECMVGSDIYWAYDNVIEQVKNHRP